MHVNIHDVFYRDQRMRIKQGDRTPITVRLEGESKFGLSAKITLVKDSVVCYTTTADVKADNAVTFSISQTLPVGVYGLEISVGQVKAQYPSDYSASIEITRSADELIVGQVKEIGRAQLIKEVAQEIQADAKLTYATKNELAQVSSKVDFTNYYTKTQIDTKLSGVVGQPGPKGDTGAPGPKGDPGIGIPQKLSKTGNALTLSNGGGQVTLDYAPSNHTHPEYATEYFVHKTLAPIAVNAQQYVDNKIASVDKVANYAPATQVQVNAGTGNAYVLASHMSVFPRKYTTRVGNGSSTVFTVAHNLGTRAVQVTTYINGEQYLSGVKIVDANNVRLTFGTAWGTNQIEVVVIG